MPTQLTLLRKDHITSNIWSFIFEPSQPLAWTAGQFIRVDLPHPEPDIEGTRRYFTIASAPYEHHIQICTRVTGSTFKQALNSLPEGGVLSILDLPAGDFTWPSSDLHPVFVAQGIGITPFYSMIKQRLHEAKSLDATLLYANLTPDIPFQTELSQWRASGLDVQLTNQPLTAHPIARAIPDLTSAIIYVSGPQPLIELLLPPYNLRPRQLKQDTFPNYDAASY